MIPDSILYWMERVPFVLFILCGIYICFFSYLRRPIWYALIGLQTGFILGFLLGRFGLQDPVLTMIVTLSAMAVLATLCASAPRIGGMMGGAGVMAIVTYLTALAANIPAAWHLPTVGIASLIGASAGLTLQPYLLVALSAINGAFLIIDGAFGLILNDSIFDYLDTRSRLTTPTARILLGGSLLVAICGFFIQLMLDQRRSWHIYEAETKATEALIQIGAAASDESRAEADHATPDECLAASPAEAAPAEDAEAAPAEAAEEAPPVENAAEAPPAEAAEAPPTEDAAEAPPVEAEADAPSESPAPPIVEPSLPQGIRAVHLQQESLDAPHD